VYFVACGLWHGCCPSLVVLEGESIGHTFLPRRVPLGFGALFWLRVLMPLSIWNIQRFVSDEQGLTAASHRPQAVS